MPSSPHPLISLSPHLLFVPHLLTSPLRGETPFVIPFSAPGLQIRVDQKSQQIQGGRRLFRELRLRASADGASMPVVTNAGAFRYS
jgi:hypothetical protein